MRRWTWLALAMVMASGCRAPDPAALAERQHPNVAPRLEVRRPAGYVGYGELVRLEAHATDEDGDELSLRWTQVAGRPVEVSGDETETLTFRTHLLDELAPPRDGPARVLVLPPGDAGHYRFRLTVSDGRATREELVTVRAGPSTPGWPRTVEGLDTFLDAGLAQDRYDWQIVFSPPRTDPVLAHANQRRPRVRLSKPGRYIVREQVSGREIALHSGPWMGTAQCGRVECHPIEMRGWAATKMATVLERGLDGLLRHDYAPRCLRCHSVGWDPTVENQGFDDMAKQHRWAFPERLQPGNFAKLHFEMRDRANVGCEACHGPGRFYTSYSAEVCAGCHDAPPEYVNPSEWRRAPMSRIREGVLDHAECRRCHTAQGFIDEFFGHRPAELTARVEDVEFEPEPITCGVCHDAHGGPAERMIRYGGPVWGQEPDVDWGTGMICIGCHQGGTQWRHERGPLMRPFVPREHEPVQVQPTLWDQRLAPHAPQASLLRGRAGHALPGPGPMEASPPHLTVPGGCVGCHVRPRPSEDDPRYGVVGGHTFAMFSGEGAERVENTIACEPCHGRLTSLNREVLHDYDGNGRREGIFDEVEGLLARAHASARAAIRAANLDDGSRRAADYGEYDGRLVLVDEQGDMLGAPDAPMTFPADQARLYRAIYNIALIEHDRSRGVHNPVWTVRLLQRTILRLTPQEVPRWYWR